ncbi:tubulin-like protein [Brachybacterium sp. JB7]|uniref:tubulin-like doman-containing protein n=1 Tax=Brachybacterium TaxID=43668 RepID=UPI000DF33186|nr:tubulin-like doman-containing protein [Brachybacterium sp. JB7]RCS66312.1 tubulin-like protein [Brachybacterium sp. JB7]
MRKVLIIGCGGSGAKTLSYMMDQLRADLAVHGVDEIPGCWQFVNVDTPIQEEHGAHLPSVGDLGGTYVSCGDTGSYAPVDAAVTQKLQANGSEGLRAAASWMPRDPSDVTFPISVGAGQSRAIGRMLTLSKAAQIGPGIRRAIDAMNSERSREQARRTSEAVPGLGGVPDPAAGAVTLVVSSMAGGSGASMTLDVCRIVSAMPEVDEDLTSLFLYTADVFGELPHQDRLGMSGNTLAMLGEIFAAQGSADGGRAGRNDADVYERLGISGTAGRPFRRVFPIGRRTGVDNMVFGDGSPDGVYRGMGRGLGRLLLSPRFDSIISYLIANVAGGLLSTDTVAWGSKADDLIWSSFGYASLSMGRDRYLEYAAERIARSSVKHVLDGFRQEGSTHGDQQQLAELWQYKQADELTRAGLPIGPANATMAGDSAVDSTVQQWFLSSAGLSQEALSREAGEAVTEAMRRRPSIDPNMPLEQWATSIDPWARMEDGAVQTALERSANALAAAFARDFHDRILDTLRQAIAEHGVVYAGYVLEKLAGPGGEIAQLVPRLRDLERLRKNRAALSVSPEFLAPYTGQRKAMVGQRAAGELEDDLFHALRDSAFGWLASTAAQKVATLLQDFGASVAQPLRKEFDDVRRGLISDSEQTPSAQGVAQLESPFVKAWPTEPDPGQPESGSVPDRFTIAHNEVVLMGVDEYVPRFSVDILDSVAAERAGDTHQNSSDPQQAHARARRDVILGEWTKGAGDVPPADLLVTTRTWVPKGVPGALAPTSGQYSLRARSSDLLRRARSFVHRRGESFEAFAAESMRSYITDPQIGEHERELRQKQLLTALRKTLVMAQPLTTINTTVQRELGTPPLQLNYQFSSIPFNGLDGLVAELQDIVARDSQISTDSVLPAIEHALSALPVGKIDVFGSYPMTFPVAYGLLRDVAEDWKGRTDAGRRDFWHWRRSRSLPGGLPFSDAERTALVRGWWVAQLAGGLDIPSGDGDRTPVRIWDPEAEEWVSFPAPMLTPPSRMIVSTAWLPAVLESSLLAYTEADEKGLRAFRPWTVLRRWADLGQFGPTVSLDGTTRDAEIISLLLGTGEFSHGLRPVVDLSAATDPEERRTLLLDYCDRVAAVLDQRFLPGAGKKDHPQVFANFRHRSQVATTPLTIDLAEEMRAELLALRRTIESASPSGPGADPIDLDDSFVF